MRVILICDYRYLSYMRVILICFKYVSEMLVSFICDYRYLMYQKCEFFLICYYKYLSEMRVILICDYRYLPEMRVIFLISNVIQFGDDALRVRWSYHLATLLTGTDNFSNLVS